MRLQDQIREALTSRTHCSSSPAVRLQLNLAKQIWSTHRNFTNLGGAWVLALLGRQHICAAIYKVMCSWKCLLNAPRKSLQRANDDSKAAAAKSEDSMAEGQPLTDVLALNSKQ